MGDALPQEAMLPTEAPGALCLCRPNFSFADREPSLPDAYMKKLKTLKVIY